MRIAFFCILLPVSQMLFADKQPLTLESAEALEHDKKYEQAMAVYEEWLKANDGDARFPAVLRRCGELKKNPLAAIELYKTYLPRIRENSLQRTLQREIALLYLLLGDNRAALEYFEKSFAQTTHLTPNDPWLAVVPSLYIACGETDKAYVWVKRVDPLLGDRALRGELNYALLEIYLVREDLDAAGRALKALEGGFRDTTAYAKALLRLGGFYLARNDRKQGAAFLTRLRREFPASLESRAAARLLSGKETDGPRLVVNPHEIMGGANFMDMDVKKPVAGEGTTTAQTTDKVTAPPDRKPDAGIRIQVGSYTVRENAEYMVRDLNKLGFTSATVPVDIKGKTYYRVFVGEGLSADEAQTILARLNDAGIGGYLNTGE